MSIQILSPEVANQIAAGEVVERPASVVKELVENSIDAGALNISIFIEKGGKSLIEVRDDGRGMSPEDAEKCILRHATSKIKTTADIFAINSFGFRGEALAAISSVSRFELLTKTEKDSTGTLLSVKAGKREPAASAPSNTGTRIKIKDLFFPTPARLEYLKTDKTEYRAIYKEITNFALSNPDVSFKFSHDGKSIHDFPATKLKIDRIRKILKISPNELVKVDQCLHGIILNGYIGRPEKGARTKTNQYIFVNERRIEDYRLCYSVRDAYLQSCGIEKHLHPIFVLFLTIDPILVDVNVHPRKLEVKFSDPQEVFSAVKSAVIQSLRESVDEINKIPLFDSLRSTFPQKNFSENKKNISAGNKFNTQMFMDGTRFAQRNKERNFDGDFNMESSSSFFPPSYRVSDTKEEATVPNEDQMRLIGQLANKYILAERSDGLFIFDQHALHERQRFERLLQEAESKKVHVQKLLIPELLEMPQDECSCLEENQDNISALGFDVKFKSPSSVKISAVPIILATLEVKSLFEDFVNYFQDYKVKEHSLEKILRKTLESRSCRGSVMFGDRLDPVEMQKLLDDFSSTKWKLLCPHGRPNHVFLGFKDLDKKFHR